MKKKKKNNHVSDLQNTITWDTERIGEKPSSANKETDQNAQKYDEIVVKATTLKHAMGVTYATYILSMQRMQCMPARCKIIEKSNLVKC